LGNGSVAPYFNKKHEEMLKEHLTTYIFLKHETYLQNEQVSSILCQHNKLLKPKNTYAVRYIMK